MAGVADARADAKVGDGGCKGGCESGLTAMQDDGSGARMQGCVCVCGGAVGEGVSTMQG